MKTQLCFVLLYFYTTVALYSKNFVFLILGVSFLSFGSYLNSDDTVLKHFLLTSALCFLSVSKESCLLPCYESGRYSEVVLWFWFFFCFVGVFLAYIVSSYKHLKNPSPGKYGIPGLLMLSCFLVSLLLFCFCSQKSRDFILMLLFMTVWSCSTVLVYGSVPQFSIMSEGDMI